jgi:hypothetical protein
MNVRLVAKVDAADAGLVKTLERTKTLHTKLQLTGIVAAGANGISAEDLIKQVSVEIAANGNEADKKRWEREVSKAYVPHVAWISKAYPQYVTTVGDYPKAERKPRAKKAKVAPVAEVVTLTTADVEEVSL